MNYKHALIVDSQESQEERDVARRLLADMFTAGLQADLLSEAQTAAALRTGALEPALVVLGPSLGNPLSIGRAIHAAWPNAHLLFVQFKERAEAFRKALGHTPLLGNHWSIGEHEDPALPEQARIAAAAMRRRAQLRTTLDRVNARLAARPKGMREAQKAMSEHYLANFLAQASESIIAVDAQQRVLYWNASAGNLLNLGDDQLLGLELAQLPFWSAHLASAVVAAGDRDGITTCEVNYQRKETELFLEIGCSGVRDRQGRTVGTILVVRDVSERHRLLEAERREQRLAEETLIREQARIRELFDLSPGFMALFQGQQHVFTLANPAFLRLFGRRSLEGLAVRDAFPDLRGQEFLSLLDQVYRSGEPWIGKAVPVTMHGRDGELKRLYLDFVYQPVVGEEGLVNGVFCQGADVTAQKLAQDALLVQQTQLERMVEERTASLRSAEQALLQAQKLESLGKLTGGVAHDFNNILQIIGGNLELLKGQFDACAIAQGRLDTAAGAVSRGAKLASQLLAFARKQPLQPVATNLARIVREMDGMLRRVLGESIHIETVIGGGLWTAMVDRNQLENVILNLAINGRDAMNGEGRLTIELGNALLDDHYVLQNAEVTTGQYVMLAVSDTGSGMSAEVIARAFEPFYTTKPEGQGTGLGLSMAYGFVKQSFGHIKIYSEAASGTTIKIYLPRVFQAEATLVDVRPLPAVGGSETILVVEDDDAVRITVVDLLTELGYRVLKANDGQSGLNVLQSGIPIDLLFTDVVMPGPVRCTELARQAKELQPKIEVLFTSGYTQNAIVHGGRLDHGVELISKPYRREDLAAKIRSLLTKRDPSPVAGPKSILVVEDNEDACQMLCEMLAMLGYRPLGAGSAEEAMALMNDTRFDVLLTDVGLPGMSGEELARQAVAADPSLHVVFATGFGAVSTPGFLSHSLTKPYDMQTLQDILNSL